MKHRTRAGDLSRRKKSTGKFNSPTETNLENFNRAFRQLSTCEHYLRRHRAVQKSAPADARASVSQSQNLHSEIKTIAEQSQANQSRKNDTTNARSIRIVNYELTVLKQVFNYAVQNRWLDRNPFKDGKNMIDVAHENRRSKTWTREEEVRALALCTDSAAHLKVVIVCIVDGGFRKGELLTAKWADVNFNVGMMSRQKL